MNMLKVSNSYLKVFIQLLALTVLAKAIAVVSLWFLPDSGVEFRDSKSYAPPYQRVDFRDMLASSNDKNKAEYVVSKHDSKDRSDIKNMILKGLYGNSSKGFVIVALKSNPRKTTIVSIGETFSSYKLKAILLNGALFVKDSKEYILKIKGMKKLAYNAITSVNKEEEPSHNLVSRSDIKFYEKHPQQIWKDIAINEIKESGRIKGFKVSYVKPNSKMDKLGLKRGDIIVRANNVKLDSYKSVYELYKNINNIDTLEIVLLRNNQEKELIYEIN